MCSVYIRGEGTEGRRPCDFDIEGGDWRGAANSQGASRSPGKLGGAGGSCPWAFTRSLASSTVWEWILVVFNDRVWPSLQESVAIALGHSRYHLRCCFHLLSNYSIKVLGCGVGPWTRRVIDYRARFWDLSWCAKARAHLWVDSGSPSARLTQWSRIWLPSQTEVGWFTTCCRLGIWAGKWGVRALTQEPQDPRKTDSDIGNQVLKKWWAMANGDKMMQSNDTERPCSWEAVPPLLNRPNSRKKHARAAGWS